MTGSRPTRRASCRSLEKTRSPLGAVHYLLIHSVLRLISFLSFTLNLEGDVGFVPYPTAFMVTRMVQQNWTVDQALDEYYTRAKTIWEKHGFKQ